MTKVQARSIRDQVGRLAMALSSEPIRDVRDSTTHANGTVLDRGWLTLRGSEIQNEEVELIAELGHIPTTLVHLVALQPGDFVAMDLQRGVEAKVAGVPVRNCTMPVDQCVASDQGSWLEQQHAQ